MGQRNRILAEVFGYQGWRVVEAWFEWEDGSRAPLLPLVVQSAPRLVLRVERRWAARCGNCFAICKVTHARLPARRWRDLPWAERVVEIEACPIRVLCRRCGECPVEFVPWADPYQRQTQRLQQQIALQAASMPVMHVAVLHALSWSTVRRAEGLALERWDSMRPAVPLRQVGVDEKWLGRRHKLPHRFVTIVSNLETGEPVWIGPGRDEPALGRWIATLSEGRKRQITLFALDMHRAFYNAIRADLQLAHARIVHDPFHVMKRAGEAITEIRKDAFFRAGPKLRAVGRGSRWLVLRGWERSSDTQKAALRKLFKLNSQLARAYQIVEELRATLRAPDRPSMEIGFARVLRRTQLRRHKHLRKLHDSLKQHREAILALGELRPPTGRIEAINNNWETLVRRARGYRDYSYLLLKLRFMTANPVRTSSGTSRFLALGLQPPRPRAA
jgi:transposase